MEDGSRQTTRNIIFTPSYRKEAHSYTIPHRYSTHVHMKENICIMYTQYSIHTFICKNKSINCTHKDILITHSCRRNTSVYCTQNDILSSPCICMKKTSVYCTHNILFTRSFVRKHLYTVVHTTIYYSHVHMY